jgi:hypothetical protein
MRAVTCTDSGCALPFCTLYTVALIDFGVGVLFFSGEEGADEFKKDGVPRRVTDLEDFGDVSSGVVAKKDDLREARLDLEESKLPGGVIGGDDSRLDFSARALILCEMPDETVIFFATPTGSATTCGGQGPEVLRVN